MTATNGGWVTSQGGWIEIDVSEISTDPANNRSLIQIQGYVWNKGTDTSTHTAADIPGSLGGTDPAGNDLSWTGPNWAIGTMGPGAKKSFIVHQEYAYHDSSGGGSVTAVVRYGTTNTTIFGNNKSISVSLQLTNLGTAADAPGNLSASGVLPTSLGLSWDPPSNDGGYPVTSYRILAFNGQDTSGSYNTYSSIGTGIVLNNLKPGAFYTFVVYAYNGHGSNGGYSPGSAPYTVQTLAGAWMRLDGAWKVATPFVRDGGVWRMAVPYIRNGGNWQPTH